MTLQTPQITEAKAAIDRCLNLSLPHLDILLAALLEANNPPDQAIAEAYLRVSDAKIMVQEAIATLKLADLHAPSRQI